MSADFALQNVAVQMGMNLLSLDGRKISSIRRFIYECYLCWKKYRISDEKVRICSGCGYNSLSKVAYSIDATGKMILHRKKGWKPNLKIMQAKERKFEEQERKKKHQHARRKKEASIFDN
jgi:RNA-binding protein NOB1